jgi:hypothetical protein
MKIGRFVGIARSRKQCRPYFCQNLVKQLVQA